MKLPLVDAAIRVNDMCVEKVVKLIKKILGDKLHGVRIAILGLTYKPGTDDVTDSPSLRLVKALLREGAQITVYDPKGIKNSKRILKIKIFYADNISNCINDPGLFNCNH